MKLIELKTSNYNWCNTSRPSPSKPEIELVHCADTIKRCIANNPPVNKKAVKELRSNKKTKCRRNHAVARDGRNLRPMGSVMRWRAAFNLRARNSKLSL